MTHYVLTPAAVRETALTLIRTTGTTTTLDVKRALRDQGFWATQATVSTAMDALAADLGWLWLSNGFYRTYALAADALRRLVWAN
ncbi:MAG: hypothetical protein AAGN64_15300 [Bacteroidota bacterium]